MDIFSQLDKKMMRRALTLARQAKGSTFPNPAVGAVIASGETIISENATHECGGPHAEAAAISLAGGRTAGATLYVTLEPCCHYGRTPPCTDAILASGIRRVVASVNDPNPLVAGKGIELLRSKGIDISVGLFENEARKINEDFFFYITHKKAWVTLKLAMTLDSCIADVDRNSQWITSPRSRKLAHELRRTHAAVVVGRGTLDKDDPHLDVRYVKGVSPARIILSSTGNIPVSSYFYKTAPSIRSIVVSSGNNVAIEKNQSTGIEFWYTGETDRGKNLNKFLEMACAENLPSLLVEGGSQIASQFLEYGLVNRLYLLYGNKILGDGIHGFKFQQSRPLDKAITLGEIEMRSLGDNFIVTGMPKY